MIMRCLAGVERGGMARERQKISGLVAPIFSCLDNLLWLRFLEFGIWYRPGRACRPLRASCATRRACGASWPSRAASRARGTCGAGGARLAYAGGTCRASCAHAGGSRGASRAALAGRTGIARQTGFASRASGAAGARGAGCAGQSLFAGRAGQTGFPGSAGARGRSKLYAELG